MSNEQDATENSPQDAAQQAPEPTIELVSDEPSEEVEFIEDPSAALREELSQATARLKTVSAAYKRMQEEFQNFKVRQERNTKIKAEILKGDTVSKMFEPVENLKRTLDAMKRQEVDASILEGLELVHKNFLDAFASLGLEEVGAEGDAFDPSSHEALTTMPVLTEDLDGTVVQVFSQGYRVGTRVIRPARVVVGQYTEPAGEA